MHSTPACAAALSRTTSRSRPTAEPSPKPDLTRGTAGRSSRGRPASTAGSGRLPLGVLAASMVRRRPAQRDDAGARQILPGTGVLFVAGRQRGYLLSASTRRSTSSSTLPVLGRWRWSSWSLRSMARRHILMLVALHSAPAGRLELSGLPRTLRLPLPERLRQRAASSARRRCSPCLSADGFRVRCGHGLAAPASPWPASCSPLLAGRPSRAVLVRVGPVPVSGPAGRRGARRRSG